MGAVSRPSSYHYVVDESLLRTIAAEIEAAIPGAEVRLFGSRARGTGCRSSCCSSPPPKSTHGPG
jgi:hypothetical protein